MRAGGALPLWVERRLDRAVERRGDAWLIPLSAGTTHRPPPHDDDGFPIIESAAEANYLMRRGVPPARILMETASYDTIGNAYFSLVIHVLPRRFRRLLVITSEFHLPRTEALFRWIYSMAGSFDLHFDATPNDGIDEQTLASRHEKENTALRSLTGLRNRIHSLEDLHRWMFTEHGAYAAGKMVDRSIDPILLHTY